MTQSKKMKMYHTGAIVDDLDVAMARWTAALGLHWAPPLTSTVPLMCPTGLEDREVRFTYSIEGPHHIELLEQINPAPYVNLTGGRHVHHVGYYTTDLVGETARLESEGLICELSGVTEDGAVDRATFLRDPLVPGLWIELVDQSVVDFLDPWLAEAGADQGIGYESPFHIG